MTTETKLQLKGLDHFALNVKDMKRAEEFYTNTLGFTVIRKSETQAGLTAFRNRMNRKCGYRFI